MYVHVHVNMYAQCMVCSPAWCTLQSSTRCALCSLPTKIESPCIGSAACLGSRC